MSLRWLRFSRKLHFPRFRAVMGFRKTMLRTEESVAEGAPERQRLLMSTFLAIQATAPMTALEVFASQICVIPI